MNKTAEKGSILRFFAEKYKYMREYEHAVKNAILVQKYCKNRESMI